MSVRQHTIVILYLGSQIGPKSISFDKMLGPWRSERLIYRAVELEDEALLTTISNDPEGFANAAPFLPIPRSKKSTTQYREYLEGNLMSAIICLPPPVDNPSATGDTGSKPIPIGVIHLSEIEPRQMQHRRSDIGINVVRQYRGQGFGSEAIKWILHWGFAYAGLHRIGLGAFEYNKGAVKLYERLGFTVEARRREFIWHEGQWWDQVEFGMLEDEWRKKYGSKSEG